MAVVIRLARAGTKKKAYYHLVATDKERCRDGKYLERLGSFNPKKKALDYDKEAFDAWIKKGAIASETVGQLIGKAAKSK